MNVSATIVTILSKLKIVDSNKELKAEMILLWLFLIITVLRAAFANLTLTIGPNIKWTILDSQISTTLPILYSLLTSTFNNYIQNSKGN